MFKGANALTVNCSKISVSVAVSTVSPRKIPALCMTSEQAVGSLAHRFSMSLAFVTSILDMICRSTVLTMIAMGVLMKNGLV